MIDSRLSSPCLFVNSCMIDSHLSCSCLFVNSCMIDSRLSSSCLFVNSCTFFNSQSISEISSMVIRDIVCKVCRIIIVFIHYFETCVHDLGTVYIS